MLAFIENFSTKLLPLSFSLLLAFSMKSPRVSKKIPKTPLPSFPLDVLSELELFRVVQKTSPISFARLRRSCKWIDQFAERNSSVIGVRAYRIDLTPFVKEGDIYQIKTEPSLRDRIKVRDSHFSFKNTDV